MSNQQQYPAAVMQVMQAMQSGQWPCFNECEFIGQISPRGQAMPQGFEYREAGPNKTPVLVINLLLYETWSTQAAGVKERFLEVKCQIFGQAAQSMRNGLAPGQILYFRGALQVQNFQIKSGQKTGQWTTAVGIVLSRRQTGMPPIMVLGSLPIRQKPVRQAQPAMGQMPAMPGMPMMPGQPGQPGQPMQPQGQPMMPNAAPAWPGQPAQPMQPQPMQPQPMMTQPQPMQPQWTGQPGAPAMGGQPAGQPVWHGQPAQPGQVPQPQGQWPNANPGVPTGTFMPPQQGQMPMQPAGVMPGMPMAGGAPQGNFVPSGGSQAPFDAEDVPF